MVQGSLDLDGFTMGKSTRKGAASVGEEGRDVVRRSWERVAMLSIGVSPQRLREITSIKIMV